VEHDLFGKPVATFPDHALAGARHQSNSSDVIRRPEPRADSIAPDRACGLYFKAVRFSGTRFVAVHFDLIGRMC
jgi:hypothetical protein